MEVAPFFVDFHHFLSIFTIFCRFSPFFCRFSRFTHLCRDLHFVEIYALFPPIFFGQNSHLRHITPFFHVWAQWYFEEKKPLYVASIIVTARLASRHGPRQLWLLITFISILPISSPLPNPHLVISATLNLYVALLCFITILINPRVP